MTDMHFTGAFHRSDTAAGARTPSASGDDFEERIAATGRQRAALQRRLDGAIADLGQARRRAATDLSNATLYGHQDLTQALLPFKDALEAALAVRTDDAAALREGLVLAARQLDAALARRKG